jgi:VWFA-related protein
LKVGLAGTACAGILLLATARPWAQGVAVFPSGIESVRLDVSVLRDGKHVAGLQADDFQVRDNGVLQKVEIVDDADGLKPVDVVLALDVSDSVRGEPLERLKAAAHAVLDMLGPEDSFSLLTFASRVQLVVSPADSRARAHEVIDATVAQRATSLYDAAFAAVVTADASRGRPLALLLSDGEDHGSYLRPEQVLRAAQGSELVVHVVFIRQAGRPTPFLRDLTAATGGEAWRADFAELREAVARALEEFRSRYTLRYERTGPSRPGWHKFDVRVRRSEVKVRARLGYRVEAEQATGRP